MQLWAHCQGQHLYFSHIVRHSNLLITMFSLWVLELSEGLEHFKYCFAADANSLSHHSQGRKRGTPEEEWLNCVSCANYRAVGQNNSILRGCMFECPP